MIHMTVYFGSESPEDRVRALLGPLADFCESCFAQSYRFSERRNRGRSFRPLWHYNHQTSGETGGRVLCSCPFRSPFFFDGSDLRFAIEQASGPEERALVFNRDCAQSRRDRVLSGAGTAMRIVSFVAFCAACCAELVRNALRIFHGIGVDAAKVPYPPPSSKPDISASLGFARFHRRQPAFVLREQTAERLRARHSTPISCTAK